MGCGCFCALLPQSAGGKTKRLEIKSPSQPQKIDEHGRHIYVKLLFDGLCNYYGQTKTSPNFSVGKRTCSLSNTECDAADACICIFIITGVGGFTMCLCGNYVYTFSVWRMIIA